MSLDYKTKRNIMRSFKRRGLALQPSALEAMMNVLQRETPESAPMILESILDDIKERMMKSLHPTKGGGNVVTASFLAQVIADLTRDGADVAAEALQLLDAVETPRLHFDTMKRRFSLLRSADEERSAFGDAEDKIDMLLQRYALVQQRMLRQDLFRPKLSMPNELSGSDDNKITPIEGLLGRKGVKILLGMILQVEEGQYYLEDPTGQVPINLSQTELLSTGFITEYSIVLVEGEMVDGTLYAHRVGHPIYEPRSKAVDAIGLQNSDIFDAVPSLNELVKLREQEVEHGQEGMFIILSDVHLNDIRVLSKLEELFRGFENFDPLPVFVLMGNFSSRYPSSSASGSVNNTISGYFDELAIIIGKFPHIAKEGRFVIIPGPNDPGLGAILPRPPIPSVFTTSLRNKVKHVHFASNPCRVRYFSKEFVLGKLDVLTKLRRNTILNPSQMMKEGNDLKGNYTVDEGNENVEPQSQVQTIIQHGVKTMLDQGHLCPVPAPECPIYWQYDHVMRLYPPPDALVIGDACTEQYYENYGECDVMNPGPFGKNYVFLVYRPFGQIVNDIVVSDVEFSQID